LFFDVFVKKQLPPLSEPRILNSEGVKLVKNRIKEARERAGFSQGGLAKKMNVTRQTISSYERGQTLPRPEVWEQLSTILNAPIPFLQGYDLDSPEWADYDAEKSVEVQSSVNEAAETIREHIAATAANLCELADFKSLKSMGENADLIRENATNKYRVEHSKDKNILDIDPFKKLDDERAENIKSPKYHMYFNGTTLRELTQLIKDTEKGDVPNDLVQRLKTIRDQVEKDSYRV
jgi:transcriptional regulator with XRE-family HTH domain